MHQPALATAPLLTPTQLDDALTRARRELSAARFAEAVAIAVPLFEQARDRRRWTTAAGAALVIAKARTNQKQPDEVLRWSHEAIAAARTAANVELECSGWVSLACEYAKLEDAGPAQAAIDEVLARVGSLATAEAEEPVYAGLTVAYSELGLLPQSCHFGRRALQASEQIGEPARRAMARANLLVASALHHEQLAAMGVPEAARLLAEMQQELPLLERDTASIDSPLGWARLHKVRAGIRRCGGEHEAVLRELHAMLRWADAMPPHLRCATYIELGMAYLKLGRKAEARDAGNRASACNPVPREPERAIDLRRLSQIEELLGRPGRALALLKRFQLRRQHATVTAMESRASALAHRLEEQSLRNENLNLREHNATLSGSVQLMEKLAATDPLTNLLNRRALEQAFAQAANSTRPAMLALIDLDHFKSINDEHSHLVGDEVLRTFAALMTQGLRGVDRAARYGGEEFAILFSALPPQAAPSAMARLRARVKGHDWTTVATGLRVSFSAGLVPVRHGENFEQAAARADALLYEAKRAGRDRVVFGTDPDTGAEAVS